MICYSQKRLKNIYLLEKMDENDLEYLNSSTIYKVNPNYVEDTFNLIKNEIIGKTTIITTDEIFTQKKEFEKLQNICLEKQKEGIEVRILTSSLKRIQNGFNPLTNFLCWNDAKHNTDKNGQIELHFDIKNFIDFKPKTNKFILSWRKQSPLRDSIANNLVKNESEIIRYHGITPKELMNSVPDKQTYLSWKELIEEYKSSLISFIIETEYWIENPEVICNEVIPFTEKIMIPFLTKSLPIVFAKEDYNEYLNNMGFFTLNKEYGINGTSVIEYNQCIQKIQSLSFNDIKKIYDNYQKEIENNYKLIIDIIKYPKLKIKNDSIFEKTFHFL